MQGKTTLLTKLTITACRLACGRHLLSIISVSCLLLMFTVTALAQGTVFTYQGRLQDGGTVANGSYDFQFTLWDAVSGGTQQPLPAPVTVTRTGLQVANGVFTTAA